MKHLLRFQSRNKDAFKEFWLAEFEKKMTINELSHVRRVLNDLREHGVSYVNRMKEVASIYPKKLKDPYKLERVMRTEEKKVETADLKIEAHKYDVHKFKIMLSIGACEICREATDNGNKIFTDNTIKYKGRTIPPIHPNCTCQLYPIL